MSRADGGAAVLEARQDACARQGLGDLRCEAGARQRADELPEGGQPRGGPVEPGAVDEGQMGVEAPDGDVRQPADRAHERLRLLDRHAEPAQAGVDLDPDRGRSRRRFRHRAGGGEVVHRGLESASQHVGQRGGGGAGEQQDRRQDACLADRHRLLEGAGCEPVGALGGEDTRDLDGPVAVRVRLDGRDHGDAGRRRPASSR